jgi:DMSO/TMAO reductase YedYZ molybdopterin-dependent catalytic subunit
MGGREGTEARTGLSRRGFLMAAAGAAVAGALPLPTPRRRLLQMNGYPIDAETPLELLGETYITPNDLFFVRHHWNPVFPDAATWTLKLDGEVERPLSLSLSDLKAMPRASATCVLQCAGNGRSLHRPIVPGVQWTSGAVGNAKWTGVRVRDVLEKAGLKAGARHLHTFGTDNPPEKVPPFHRSLELDKVREDGIIAFEMNGAPLPQLHGGPARLVVPGWAGDHWMKWLDRLSAQTAPQTGFYMDTAYRFPKTPGAAGVTFKPEEMTPVTELFVKSNITEAPSRARVGKKATIRGVAFSGAPDVARVEVSDDFGMTWTEAVLGKDHDPFAWRLWSFTYLPRAAGKTTLVARATDSRGSVQPKDAIWNQSGYLYNAWPSVEIEVSA